MLWGCPDPQPGDSEEDCALQVWYRDADADGFGSSALEACSQPEGYVAGGLDCNDEDPGVHPDAAETCDGADQDCDGQVDEEASDLGSWFLDADGDGYGAGEARTGCEPASNEVAVDGDCDDEDSEAFPEAEETWYDGVDQDCLGDDDFDADADGWTLDVDCDDEEPAVHPDAEEVCGDDIDNDCDGGAPNCGLFGDLDLNDGVLWQGQSANWAGWSLAAEGGRVLVGQPQLAGGAGGVSLLDTPLDGGALSPVSGPESGSWFGFSVVWCDLDGDGDADAYGGATNWDDSRGAIYGLSTGLGARVLEGEANDGDLGATMACGDLDGDGLDDLVSGAPGVENNGGALRILTASGELDVGGGEGKFGEGLAVRDVDGDGVDDLLAGARSVEHNGVATGAAYLVLGPVGSGDIADADVRYNGDKDGDKAGFRVEAGDMDGDGSADDVVVGALAGERVYVAFDGHTLGPHFSLVSSDVVVQGTATKAFTGQSFVVADLDGDDVDDLVVGAPGADDNRGAIYVLYGPLSGSLELPGAEQAFVDGAGLEAYAAFSLAADDLDGDGYPELLVGGSGENRVWILTGGAGL